MRRALTREVVLLEVDFTEVEVSRRGDVFYVGSEGESAIKGDTQIGGMEIRVC